MICPCCRETARPTRDEDTADLVCGHCGAPSPRLWRFRGELVGSDGLARLITLYSWCSSRMEAGLRTSIWATAHGFGAILDGALGSEITESVYCACCSEYRRPHLMRPVNMKGWVADHASRELRCAVCSEDVALAVHCTGIPPAMVGLAPENETFERHPMVEA